MLSYDFILRCTNSNEIKKKKNSGAAASKQHSPFPPKDKHRQKTREGI